MLGIYKSNVMYQWWKVVKVTIIWRAWDAKLCVQHITCNRNNTALHIAQITWCNCLHNSALNGTGCLLSYSCKVWRYSDVAPDFPLTHTMLKITVITCRVDYGDDLLISRYKTWHVLGGYIHISYVWSWPVFHVIYNVVYWYCNVKECGWNFRFKWY